VARCWPTSNRGRRLPLRPAVRTAIVLAGLACATNPSSVRVPKPANQIEKEKAVGCLDTLRATDSLETVVRLVLTPQKLDEKLPPEFEGLFAEAFRRFFKPPRRLPLSVVMGWEPCDSLGVRCAGGVMSLGTVAYFAVRGDGTLSDPVIVDETLTPDLAETVRVALKAMVQNHDVPWPGNIDSIAVVATLAPESDSDTAATPRDIFRAKVPRYSIPFAYAAMPAAGVDASYPFRATLAGVGDSVTVAFTVQANGVIAPESIDLVAATYGEFVSSVADALEKTRYHPARLGDCAVATRIKQRFVFRFPGGS
jgi:Gram-negative bacterial TonB protein C-terminal